MKRTGNSGLRLSSQGEKRKNDEERKSQQAKRREDMTRLLFEDSSLIPAFFPDPVSACSLWVGVGTEAVFSMTFKTLNEGNERKSLTHGTPAYVSIERVLLAVRFSRLLLFPWTTISFSRLRARSLLLSVCLSVKCPNVHKAKKRSQEERTGSLSDTEGRRGKGIRTCRVRQSTIETRDQGTVHSSLPNRENIAAVKRIQ